jgi:hypothetical protein
MINKEISELRMKIDNIKEEGIQDMEKISSEKKMKQKCITKWKANPADKNKQKTESQNLKMKW